MTIPTSRALQSYVRFATATTFITMTVASCTMPEAQTSDKSIIAALTTATMITIVTSFGVILWQRRRHDREMEESNQRAYRRGYENAMKNL